MCFVLLWRYYCLIKASKTCVKALIHTIIRVT